MHDLTFDYSPTRPVTPHLQIRKLFPGHYKVFFVMGLRAVDPKDHGLMSLNQEPKYNVLSLSCFSQVFDHSDEKLIG